MPTLTRGREPNGEFASTVACVTCANPEHHLVAARRAQMQLRDRRWLIPQDVIAEHDYCAIHRPGTEPLRVEGRDGFCPLGALAEDHEWVETIAI